MIAPVGSDLKPATERPLSFLQTVKAVAWSFVGLRKRAGYEQDVQRLNPLHVIVAGIMGAGIFILSLILVVKWVIASGVAA
ncbi:MAG: DUF2970 domain-containing protein [Betaproteobacteria bacterium]|jgi:hypothetical protein